MLPDCTVLSLPGILVRSRSGLMRLVNRKHQGLQTLQGYPFL
jgi:hypothetical protein